MPMYHTYKFRMKDLYFRKYKREVMHYNYKKLGISVGGNYI
jgi:hypothetical protein